MYLTDDQVDTFREVFGAMSEFSRLTDELLRRATSSAIGPTDAARWQKLSLRIQQQTAIVAAMLEQPGGGVN
jgi:hypothetical protein